MNKKPSKFLPEVRERAVRLVREQRDEHPSLWAAVESIAGMIGCTPQTLHEWVKRDQIDQGERAGVTTDERERLKALERENKELRRANEILKLASAFFAQAERRCARPDGNVKRRCCARSNACGTATCACTVPTRSGSNCAARTLQSRAARWSG